MKKSVCALILMLVLIPAPGRAEVRLRERTENYPVRGTTWEELIAQLNRHGPYRDGLRYWGYTSWKLEGEYHYQKSAAGCAIPAVDVDINLVYQLPKWIDAGKTDEATRQRWQSEYTKLKTHEEGHKALARQAADTLIERITSLPAEPSCEAIGITANQVWIDTRDEFRLKEKAYDKAHAVR